MVGWWQSWQLEPKYTFLAHSVERIGWKMNRRSLDGAQTTEIPIVHISFSLPALSLLPATLSCNWEILTEGKSWHHATHKQYQTLPWVGSKPRAKLELKP